MDAVKNSLLPTPLYHPQRTASHTPDSTPMPSHLPLLLNPLLNAIFNNPRPEKSPLKDVYNKLRNSWEDGTVIVAPPLQTLLNYYDTITDTTYADLCYSEAFIKDHIITTHENKNAKLFMSLSGKELLVKRDTLFTGKGFKKSLQLKVVKCEYFQSFSDYFPKGRQFMIMHVTAPLFGEPLRSPVINLIAPSSNTVERAILLPPSDKVDDNRLDTTAKDFSLSSSIEIPSVRFEQLMRTYPLISRSVGSQYEKLFRSFSTRDVPDSDSLTQMFMKSIESASLIFQTLSDDIVSTLLDESPQLDLNECVYNYVEMNLYDKLWSKLCDLNGDSLSRIYGEIENLSINQTSLPCAENLTLDIQCALEKRVAKAVTEFKKLELTTDAISKIKVFVDTVSILSATDEVVVDADTLVGLLLLVISHAGVSNLENHLYYALNFSFQNVDVGLTGYSLSTFEGVLYYLRDDSNVAALRAYSKQNKRVFSCIDDKELLELKKLADSHTNEVTSSFKSRTPKGESLLMQAIQSNDYDTWKLLIDYEEIFPLEDIIQDRNINDTSLLCAALNCENFDMIDEITEIILSSCTTEELIHYLNAKDQHCRTAGHYLFHYKELIPKLGPYIDWRLKDANGQTPLFALCRSYDCADYSGLIEVVFNVVDEWYKSNESVFDYEDHIDNRGNTLLHIMNSKIDIVLKYDRINVNEVNEKGYTALMIYSKYNRLENTRKLVHDPLISLAKPDKSFFTALDQAKHPQVSKVIELQYLNEKVQKCSGKQIGVMRVRLENGFWKLSLRGCVNGQEYETLHAFSEFRHLVMLMKMEFPNTFIPLEYTLRHFDMLLNFGTFNKLKLNKIVDHLNIALQAFMLNSPLLNYELLWEFLADPSYNKEELTQRTKLRVLNYHEDILGGNSMDRNGHTEKEEVFLQPEEISEINFFLKFSLKELNKLRTAYDKLFKIVNFHSRKAVEVKDAETLFAEADSSFSQELKFVAGIMKSKSKELEFDSELCESVLYLSLASDELILKVNNMINSKIFRWWKLYGELIELNNSYKKFKQVEHKKGNTPHTNGEVEGLVHVNEESFQDLTMVTSFQNNQSKKSKKAQPSFLSNFIESKRHKYEAKLLESMRGVKKSLVELNRDLKFNHETIAMEVNNFFNFKTDFLTIVTKKYVKKQIRDLKFQNMMLSRGLSDLRSLKP